MKAAARKLTLRRAVPKGKHLPRLSLWLAPSKRQRDSRWRQIFLGTLDTVTQARIDEAVNLLEKRNVRYLEVEKEYGLDFASSEDGTLVVLEVRADHPLPPQSRLLLADAVAFNGIGDNIGYTPRREISRTHAVPKPPAPKPSPPKPKKNRVPWTPREDGLLVRHCKTMGIEALRKQYFRARSYHSIAQRISHLKLGASRKDAAKKGKPKRGGGPVGQIHKVQFRRRLQPATVEELKDGTSDAPHAAAPFPCPGGAR